MKRPGFTFLFMLIGLLESANAPQAAATTNLVSLGTNNSASNPMIVTLRRGVDLDGLVKEHALKPHCSYRHAFSGFAILLNSNQVERLKHDPRVVAVEPDGKVRLCSQTVPAGVLRMGITNFPVAHIDGTDHRIDVDVAVLDTGIQTNHPDLNVVQAVGFADPGLNGNDWHGHGTAVAGVVGALDNDIGVVGVAPGVRLWSVQVIGPKQAAWSNVLAGLDYIATNTDRISLVNASFESYDGSDPWEAMREAVSNIVAQGVVFVAAAGNDSTDITGPGLYYGGPTCILPAALPEVMTVSAMNPTNDVFATDFSNYSTINKVPQYVTSPGHGIDVIAPGVGILSTYISGGYATFDGTSMASPHVAGLVALYIAANGRPHSLQDVNTVRQAIIDGSQPQGTWNPTPCSWPTPMCNPTVYSTQLCNFFTSCANPGGTDWEALAMPSEGWVPVSITRAEFLSGIFSLSFNTAPNYLYSVQYAETLPPAGAWSDLVVTNGDSGTLTVTDSAPDLARFYRVARSGPGTLITNFTSSGAAPWFLQTNVMHKGMAEWQSGAVASGQQSVLNTTVIGPGVVSFWWSVPVPGASDTGLQLTLDGGLWDDTEPYAGSSFAGYNAVPISAGMHTLGWIFNASSGSSPGYVSEVRFMSQSPWTY